MNGLDIFAWIVLAVLLIAGVVIWFVLAMLPGRIARARNHPQADAINVAGWLGALFGGVFWPLALIWAFYKPGAGQAGDTPDAPGEAEAG
jgi:Kef-type K+ transport system membrane component KefB